MSAVQDDGGESETCHIVTWSSGNFSGTKFRFWGNKSLALMFFFFYFGQGMVCYVQHFIHASVVCNWMKTNAEFRYVYLCCYTRQLWAVLLPTYWWPSVCRRQPHYTPKYSVIPKPEYFQNIMIRYMNKEWAVQSGSSQSKFTLGSKWQAAKYGEGILWVLSEVEI